MSKRVSESQKIEIIKSFKSGIKIKEISATFDITSQTITRQLKKLLGNEEFNKIKDKNDKKNQIKKKHLSKFQNNKEPDPLNFANKQKEDDFENINFSQHHFVEISPLHESIEFDQQKDLTSVPIENFDFPKTVFMIVNKSIELEPKTLGEYPEWSFLPTDDLRRKTILIYENINLAKKVCRNSEKVIKVPNPKVFSLASKILKTKGISRIIFEDSLLSL